MNTYLLLFAATVAALVSLGMWYAFVRPAPQQAATGVITSKSLQAARTINRYQGGARREAWTEERIRVPESYVFEIRVEGLSTPVRYWAPVPVGEKYQVGQRVRIRYVERSIPFFRRRLNVIEMLPASAGQP